MGLSTWSVFRRDINDTLLREPADAMVSTGLAAAGYDSILDDDGWESSGWRVHTQSNLGHCLCEVQKCSLSPTDGL
jgi:hypothetical protein